MKNYSIIRGEEYKNLSRLNLEGKILDVGGSKISGYHELAKGNHEYIVINIDEYCKPDYFVDIEGKFPFEDASFDHAICLNVLEHVFEFENVVSETVRTLRKNGTMVVAVPMLHHIHGSPDDFIRYTESALRRLFKKYDCEVVELQTLGSGFFSLGFQCVGGFFPTDFLRLTLKDIAIFLDTRLSKLSKKYKTLTDRLPLGYFVVAKKL